MQIIKITTYGRDNKGNVSGEKETYFADSAQALAFAKSDGRINGGDDLKNRHFWSDEVNNAFAAFDATGETGEKITKHAEVSFHELS